MQAKALMLTAIVLYACSAQTPVVMDLDGRPVTPVAKGVSVLLFTRTDCPIANKYAPELQRLHGRYAAAGVSFWLVYVDTAASTATIRSHKEEYGYKFAALVDAGHVLVRLADARATPEAAVFNNDQLVYRGRIDDRFAALGKARTQPQTHDLEAVLMEVTAGKSVPFRSTPAVGCAIEASQAATTAPTFAQDIAPIVFEKCAPCHRPGEAAPFSLLTYEDVKAHAKQIATVTASGLMPPWKPASGKGEFEGETRLTAGQIRTIEQWVAGGAAPGSSADQLNVPVFSDEGRLGKPDLLVTLDRPYTLAAAGPDVFRNFVLRLPLQTTRFARAIEIRPGNKRVVHHANLLVDRTRSSRVKDGKDGAPGFPGMDVRIETKSFDPESHFLFWKPGTPSVEEPDGMALQLDAGTDLILNMHLQPGGKPESIQPSVAIYFTDKPPVKRPMLVQLENDGALDIPVGSKDFVVADHLTLPVDVDLLGIYPHAHYLGRDIQAIAVLPDGSTRWLIHIPDWDINWQAVYRYKKPVFLPKGSQIKVRFAYDNSTGNVRNPHSPPQRVRGGDRSDDEMAHVWLQVLPRKAGPPDARPLIQKAVLQRRLEKYPRDFYAQFSLGAIAQSEGKTEDAVRYYRSALRASPDDAAAHNALGAALLERGSEREAEAEFQTAIRLQPQSADPRYNLARILLRRERVDEAIVHLREVLRLEPQDASATSDLGAALFMSGNPREGLPLLQRAVALQPDSYDARYNLGQALAAVGRPSDARQQFTEALRLRPGDPDALAATSKLSTR